MPDEILVYTIQKALQQRTVIKRDLHNLSPAGIRDNEAAVRDGMYSEIKQWIGFSCMRRMLKSRADNLVDGTWVPKWKVIDGIKKVKGRLTLRGFKDKQTDIENFSATATRHGARAVNSFAAQCGHILWSLDIPSAFLKGLTFEEINAMKTSGEIRSVQLMIGARTAAVLRTFVGYENFDPQTEYLDMLRPMEPMRRPASFHSQADQCPRRDAAPAIARRL